MNLWNMLNYNVSFYYVILFEIYLTLVISFLVKRTEERNIMYKILFYFWYFSIFVIFCSHLNQIGKEPSN